MDIYRQIAEIKVEEKPQETSLRLVLGSLWISILNLFTFLKYSKTFKRYAKCIALCCVVFYVQFYFLMQDYFSIFFKKTTEENINLTGIGLIALTYYIIQIVVVLFYFIIIHAEKKGTLYVWLTNGTLETEEDGSFRFLE